MPVPYFAHEPWQRPSRPAEPPRSPQWRTPEGIDLAAVYGPSDVADLSAIASVPGLPPYLR